jgi:predicted Zn-dependent protease
MQPLEPPNTFHLSAASGWMELANLPEAWEELRKIPPALQNHPAVLEMRWQLHAQAKDWDQALEVAQVLVAYHPDRAQGWIHRAYAMRRAKAGGLQDAWDALLPAIQLFPDESVIPYNIACYAAQLGKVDEAWTWLQSAMNVGGAGPMKRMALADSDLEALWDRLRKI